MEKLSLGSPRPALRRAEASFVAGIRDVGALGRLPPWYLVPALVPAAFAWAGAAFGGASRSPATLLWLTLLLFACTLRRRSGWCLVALTSGYLLAVAEGSGPPPLPDLERPVKVTARITEEWRMDRETWVTRASSSRWQQDLASQRIDVPLRLYLPGSIAPPSRGSLVRLTGFLDRSPGYANRPAIAGGGWHMQVKSAGFLEPLEPPRLVWRIGTALRSRVYECIGRRSGSAAGALAGALLLGDSTLLSDRSRSGLRRWGLAHLTAVSGLHLALAIAPVWWLVPASRRGLRIVASVSIVLVYLLLVGPRPSLLRASVMAVFMLVGAWTRRPFAALHGLSLAVLCLLAMDVTIARNLGFSLSVSATTAILIVTGGSADRKQSGRASTLLRDSIASCSAAWLATLPWVAATFHVVVPASPALNLLFVPWITVALPLLALWVGVDLFCPATATEFLPLLEIVAEPARWPGLLPSIPWLSESVSWSFCEATGVALVLALWLWRPSWRTSLAVAAMLLMVAVDAPDSARLALIDVGQGDAVLLADGDGAVLVDTGGWIRSGLASRVLLPALSGLGVRRLDAVVITHGDRDHCGALASLVDHLPVKAIWTTAEVRRSPCLEPLDAADRARIEILAPGDRRRVGSWSYLALHPPPGHRLGDNDSSLVLLAEHRGRRALLTGDIEGRAERSLMELHGELLQAEILKVAHHGSRTSSSRALLELVSPRLALISAGVDNRYGHPAGLVLDRFAEMQIPVMRTDRAGLVVVHFREQGRLEVETPGAPR